LKLNADKIEFRIIDTEAAKATCVSYNLPLLNQLVMPAVSTRNLAVIFDDEFNYREHISHL